jgi:sulfate transport system permease protein
VNIAIAAPARSRWREPSVLPGFRLSLGFTLFYLSIIVLIPLAALLLRPWSLGWSGFIAVITAPRVLAALKLSFGAAAIAAGVNAVFGLLVAWTLVRYRFPGKRLIDALVDLPFALPTAVAGIALSTLYAPTGWLGAPLALLGIKVAYAPLGVVIALIFIGLPFVVRTLQPVLADMGADAEEAAATLGATRTQTFFRVVMPALAPALVTGTGLAFARAVGEYGSVIFIAGNLPMVSEIAPLLITVKLEQYDYAGAASIGIVMLAASFLIVLGLNIFQSLLAARR